MLASVWENVPFLILAAVYIDLTLLLLDLTTPLLVIYAKEIFGQVSKDITVIPHTYENRHVENDPYILTWSDIHIFKYKKQLTKYPVE